LVAAWGTKVALRNLPSALPRANEIAVDFRVLLFTTGASLLCGILFGTGPGAWDFQTEPARYAERRRPGSERRETPSAGSFCCLGNGYGAGAPDCSGIDDPHLSALWNVNPGFDSHNVLTFGVALAPSAKATSRTRFGRNSGKSKQAGIDSGSEGSFALLGGAAARGRR